MSYEDRRDTIRCSEENGPVKKFALIKRWGKTLRKLGFDPQKMSCTELEASIAALEHQEGK